MRKTHEFHGPIKSDLFGCKDKSFLIISQRDLLSTGIIYPQKNEGSEFNGRQERDSEALKGLVKK